MSTRWPITALLLLCAMILSGCRSASSPFVSHIPSSAPIGDSKLTSADGPRQAAYVEDSAPANPDADAPLRLPPPVAAEETAPGLLPDLLREDAPEELAAPPGAVAKTPSLEEVAQSVRIHYPLVRQAVAARVVASGEALSALGAFDRKFKGYGNAQPLDFYENYWQKWGLERDTMWGGRVWAGYRLGRGFFEPWYKERETNGLGELAVSLSAPLARNRSIDANRAELWQAELERNRVEPMIRAEVIDAVRDGARAYWQWVAAGANLRVAEGVLQLGVDRIDYLTRQIELGEKARIDLVDNRRIIVTRQAKLIDAQRKLRQAGVKLSLYLRSEDGRPLTPSMDAAPMDFPEITPPDESLLASDIEFAIDNRPELIELSVIREQLAIAQRQAANEMRPQVDGGLFMGQDIGAATPARDKSEFQLQATLTVSTPLERRKAKGKLRQLRGKLVQVRAKMQFATDKVATEVQVARVALLAAAERIGQTAEGVRLTERMQVAEKRLFDEGQSTLFNLNLREQQTAEAAAVHIDAQLDYFLAQAEYAAALGLEEAKLDGLFR